MGHWAAPFVDAMAKADLVKGFFDGSFRPDNFVTRAEFAALAMATFPPTGSDRRRFKPFRDVPSGFWARPVIYQAQAQGFIAGFPDNTFRPNDPMTRAQTLVALVVLCIGGGLLRRGLGLVLGLPLAVWHAVDNLPCAFLIELQALFVRGVLVPVRQAVAAKATEVHQIDVLNVRAFPEVGHQSPECGGFQFCLGLCIKIVGHCFVSNLFRPALGPG